MRKDSKNKFLICVQGKYICFFENFLFTIIYQFQFIRHASAFLIPCFISLHIRTTGA